MKTLCIRFKKGTSTVLECTRADKTITWCKIQPGMVLHDLGHYVVETTLGFTYAFYGLIAAGWDIADFEKPRERRPTPLLPKNLPEEALLTEHIVNMLITSMQPGTDLDSIYTSLKTELKTADFATQLNLNFNHFKRMQEDLQRLWTRWQVISDKETLELQF